MAFSQWPANSFRLTLFEPGLHPDICARVNVASHTAAIRASFLEVVSKPLLAANRAHLTANTHRILGGQVVVRRLVLHGRKKNIGQFLIRAALSEERF